MKTLSALIFICVLLNPAKIHSQITDNNKVKFAELKDIVTRMNIYQREKDFDRLEKIQNINNQIVCQIKIGFRSKTFGEFPKLIKVLSELYPNNTFIYNRELEKFDEAVISARRAYKKYVSLSHNPITDPEKSQEEYYESEPLNYKYFPAYFGSLYGWKAKVESTAINVDFSKKDWYHECKHVFLLEQKPLPTGGPFEEITSFNNKCNKQKPITFKEVNGLKICRLYYCSYEDRTVHFAELTRQEYDQLLAYKFRDLEDCLKASNMIERLFLKTHPNEETIVLRTNIKGASATSLAENISLGVQKGFDFIYGFEKLKPRYLEIKVEHPACRDTIIEMSKRDRFENVILNFKKNYLNTEFAELKKANDISSLKLFRSIVLDSLLQVSVSNYIDSLEIDECQMSGNGDAIARFLNDRPGSSLYARAVEVKQYYENAELAYASAIKNNAIIDYQSFLKKYGYSNHYDEINKKFIDLMVEKYIRTDNIDSMLYCHRTYLLPNSDYREWTDAKIKKVCDKIENILVDNTNKDSIDNLKKSWGIMTRVEGEMLVDLKTFKKSFRNEICELYFNNMKSIASKISQDSLFDDFKKSFKGISDSDWIRDDDGKSVLNFIFENTISKNGAVRLFSIKYLQSYLQNGIKGYRPLFAYRGAYYNITSDYTCESLNWINNKIIGKQQLYFNDKLVYEVDLTPADLIHEEQFYQNGQLIVRRFYENGSDKYFFEYDNGVNISLVELRKAISVCDQSLKDKNYQVALDCYLKAENKYPEDIQENVHIRKSISQCEQELQKSFSQQQANSANQYTGQIFKRNPDGRKDHANVFFKKQYTLFDLHTDEPILPDAKGIYIIYTATNESKVPKQFKGTADELEKVFAYKFKNITNCRDWCSGKASKVPVEHTTETASSYIQNNNSTNSAENQNDTENTNVKTRKSVYFETESDVIEYMDGKTFINEEMGLRIEYGYYMGTLAIKVKNRNGYTNRAINVKIQPFGRAADLYGILLDGGQQFGFRVYNDDKLVVGRGLPGEVTFILEE